MPPPPACGRRRARGNSLGVARQRFRSSTILTNPPDAVRARPGQPSGARPYAAHPGGVSASGRTAAGSSSLITPADCGDTAPSQWATTISTRRSVSLRSDPWRTATAVSRGRRPRRSPGTPSASMGERRRKTGITGSVLRAASCNSHATQSRSVAVAPGSRAPSRSSHRRPISATTTALPSSPRHSPLSGFPRRFSTQVSRKTPSSPNRSRRTAATSPAPNGSSARR